MNDRPIARIISYTNIVGRPSSEGWSFWRSHVDGGRELPPLRREDLEEAMDPTTPTIDLNAPLPEESLLALERLHEDWRDSARHRRLVEAIETVLANNGRPVAADVRVGRRGKYGVNIHPSLRRPLP